MPFFIGGGYLAPVFEGEPHIFEEDEENNNTCRMIDEENLKSTAIKGFGRDLTVTSYVGCHVKNFYLISELVDILYESIIKSKILDPTHKPELKTNILLFLIKKSFQGYFNLFCINYEHKCVLLKKEAINENYRSYMSFFSNNFENIKINAIELANFKIKNEDVAKCYMYGAINNNFFQLNKSFNHISCLFDVDDHFDKELFELYQNEKPCSCNQFLNFHKCERVLTCSMTGSTGKITTFPINYEFYKLFSNLCKVRNLSDSVAHLFYTFLICHKDCSYKLSDLQFLNTVFYNCPNDISSSEKLFANRIIGGTGITGVFYDEYKKTLSEILQFANFFTKNIYINSSEFYKSIDYILSQFYEFEEKCITASKVGNSDKNKHILVKEDKIIDWKTKKFHAVAGEWECFDKSSWRKNDLLTAEFVKLACKFENDKVKIYDTASKDLLDCCKKKVGKEYKQDDITHFYSTMTKRASSLSAKMKLPKLPSKYNR